MGGTSGEMLGARERVRRAAEEALEPLAVIGAEGHGKSTLVDVIVGADVVPREEQDPGTVAPVLLRWGPELEPHYSVRLDGGDGREPVPGVTEFRELLTQKLNPHNHKGVRMGYVEWQHEALAGGMSLLDVPGLAGDSATVSAQLERHMAEVRKVILLVRDRRYAHAADALRRFAHLRVDAVVCNWEAAMFDQGDVAAKVADQPTALRLNVGVDVDPDQVFVLHLPSLEQWGTRRRRVEHPVHDTEVTRFWHWVGDTASPLAADRLLAAWASAIEEAVELLDAHYADRSGILIEDSQSDEESNAASVCWSTPRWRPRTRSTRSTTGSSRSPGSSSAPPRNSPRYGRGPSPSVRSWPARRPGDANADPHWSGGTIRTRWR